MVPRGKPLLLPGLLVVVAAGTLVTGALTPRDLSLGESGAPTATGDLAAFDVSRIVTLGVVYLGLVASAFVVIREGLPRPGLRIWLAYGAFLVLNAIIPGLIGAVPGIDPRALYVPVAVTALYVSRPMAPEALDSLVKGVLLAFIYGSLAMVAVDPAHALAAGYGGIVPGLDVRLYGIAGGATSLGAQGATYLAMEWFSPSRSRLRPVHVLVALVVLVLTQAKTSWAFLLLCGLVSGYRRVRSSLAVAAERSPAVARLQVVGFGLGALCAVWLGTWYLGRLDLGALQGGANLRTFTGRTYIWATSLAVWLDHPLFGYGPSLWATEAFRAQYGSFGHAHNQLIQSLAGAGVVGLAGLLYYLGTAFALASRWRHRTPVPLVLFSMILFLSMMDVPLQGLYLLDAFVLLHLLLFAMLVNLSRLEDPREGSPA